MEQNKNNTEVSIVEIIYVIKSKFLYLILVSLVFAAFTYIYFEFIKKDVYQSEGTMIINFSEPASTVFGEYSPNSSKINDYLGFLNNHEVAQKTLKDLGLEDSITPDQINSGLSYLHDISSESNLVKLKLSIENEKSNFILSRYIDNFINLLNSKVALKALNYFQKEYSVTSSEYETRNKELEKEIKQIEELMEAVNRGVSKEEINSLQREGVLVNLSDVLNENYIILEEELIKNKRQVFNNQTKLETYRENVKRINKLKEKIKSDRFSTSFFDIVHDKTTVLMTQQEHTSTLVSKSPLPKSIIAFIVAFGLVFIYYVYRYIASLHYPQKQ